MRTPKNQKPRLPLTVLAVFLLPVLIFAGAIVDSAASAAEAEGTRAEDTIRIKGSEFLQWNPENQHFYGSGDIVITFDDLILTGDKMVFDREKQELYLEGSVTLSQGEAYMEGDSLVYRILEEKGEFTEPRTQLVSEKVTGPIFVFGDQLHIDSGDYFLHDGIVSTCDLSEPHYHLAVKEIEVYPDDKMIIRGVTFYEGKLPLFYWPYLVIPLDERYEDLDLSLPEIGYNPTDGYYIKNRYNYHLSSNAYGSLLFDYYTRKGLGLGVDHHYRHDEFGSGGIAFYILPFAAGKYLVGQVAHEFEQDNVRFSTANSCLRQYQENVLEQDTASSTTFTYQTGTTRLSLSFDYGMEQKGSEREQAWSAGGSWQQQLAPNWNMNLSSKVAAKDETKTYDHLAETSYSYKNHRFNLAFEQKHNPDLLSGGSATSWKSMHRVPELTWQWSKPNLLGLSFPSKFQLSLGRFKEYPSEVVHQRAAPSLELYSRSWRSDFGTTVTYSGQLSGSFYDGGQSQRVAYGRIGVTQKLTDTASITANYYKRLVWGETPFKFDRENEQDLLRGTFRYTKRPWTLTLNSGYDFLKDRYESLRAQINFNSTAVPVIASVNLNYDLNNKRFGDLTGNVNYRPQSDWLFRLGVVYNIHSKTWKRVTGKVLFDLTDTINVSYNLNYEPQKAIKLKQSKLVLTFDLHCRKLEMSYDQVKEEFRVQYSINAFPKLPIGYSSQEGIKFFKLEDLQDVLGLD